MADFPFQRALITGASSGIGEAMVELLGRAGIAQVVVARRVDRLEELAARFDHVEVFAADLTKPSGLAAVEERISDEASPIDLVVNNAGFGTSGEFHTLEADRLQREITLNITALTRLSHAALRVMIPRRRGYLLNVSSVVSFQPAPKLAVYAATKAYVTSLTESLHGEVAKSGVKVSALCPGLTRTEFQSVSNSDAYASQYPAFAWMTSNDVARDGLRGVAKGKAVIVPGMLYKGMVSAAGVLPNSIVRRLAGLAQR